MSSTCCVVVPVHTLQMNAYQYASIVQIAKMLKHFDIYVIHPEDLDISSLKKLGMKNMPFSKMWFASYGAYNRLCMSRCFYDAFISYDYMLIAQNDTWILKDELQYWCNKGYDYIGAPWCHFCKNIKACNYIEDPVDVIVGNGGLSLRKIKKLIEASEYITQQHLLDNCKIEDTQAEDITLMQLPICWNIPKCSEAVQFSVESLALKHAQCGIIPFGYHNLLKISPQAAMLLQFNANIVDNFNYFKSLQNCIEN